MPPLQSYRATTPPRSSTPVRGGSKPLPPVPGGATGPMLKQPPVGIGAAASFTAGGNRHATPPRGGGAAVKQRPNFGASASPMRGGMGPAPAIPTSAIPTLPAPETGVARKQRPSFGP